MTRSSDNGRKLSTAGFPEDGAQRVLIEAVEPSLDGGASPVKRVIMDRVVVSADLIADGHDVVAGELCVRAPVPPGEAAPTSGSGSPTDEARLQTYPLEALGNDRYAARFVVDTLGRYEFTIRAWIDHYTTYRRGLLKKHEAGQDVSVELLIGAELCAEAAARAKGEDRAALQRLSAELGDRSKPPPERVALVAGAVLTGLMARYPDRSHATHAPWLPIWVDRERARFSSWYELFPRSTGAPGKHGTFASATEKLPYVAAMGFDVLYLPPIHPIGHTFRKGKNNAANAAEGDVGSPWAIGSEDGGHKSVHPELGTLEDFDAFKAQASRLGLELALDIALQVTPDHPYVKEHPEWFRRRPDGTIQYAENPPKKYQDIYPFDFESKDWRNMWVELKSIFEFWIGRGVFIFRVDNPHTKSLPFWRWCIAELTASHPDVLFLAEAFTRPKLMYALAKIGFSQSYTYFTWRHTAHELSEYVRELSEPPVSEFFRPNFWPNTPDILPEHLQYAGRPAFALRLALAATLSSNYGVYGPAFELMENVPREGVEEYVDNEKYELKRWDYARQDSLRPLITRINQIRKQNAALQYGEITFHETNNDMLLCFSKRTPPGVREENAVLVVANMDVHNPQAGWVELDLAKVFDGQSASSQPLQLHDLLSDGRYFSEGGRLFVRLDPSSAPAHIFRLRRRARSEHDFDYFV